MGTRIWAASLACVATLALAGCGTTVHRVAANKLRLLRASQRATLVTQLNRALAADQEAIFGYTIAGPLLSSRVQRVDGRFLGDENTHAGVLRALIVAAGGKPHQRSASYDLGDPSTDSQVLALLQKLEELQIERDLGAIPRVPSAWVRTVLASILADDAQHLTVLSAVQGRSRDDSAFVEGAFVGGEPPTPPPAQPDALRILSRVELIAASIDADALRSGRLSLAACRLLAILILRERAHAKALEQALGTATRPAQAISTRLSADVAGLVPRSWPRTRHAWLALLGSVQSRVEGVFYMLLPNLSAPEALLAASIFAADAQQSALLAELQARHVEDAVPAALVRGWCPPAGCTD